MRFRVELALLALLPLTAAIAAVAFPPFTLRWGLLFAWALGICLGLLLLGAVRRDLQRTITRLLGIAARLRDAGGSAIRDEDLRAADPGELASLYTQLGRDIRRRLQDADERRQETEAIFARMADGVLVVDHELRIRRANPAAAELLGLSMERAVGRTIIEATVHHALDELFREAVSAGETRSRRLEIIQPRRRVIQALVTPLESRSAATAGAVAVFQDLTELDRVERVRRDFVTNVSHELRTPVTSIKVMVESLQRGAADQPELRDTFLRSIHESADRLAGLVDDVLSLARVEASPVRLPWQEIDLGELIDEVVDAHQPLAGDYGVQLSAELADVSIQGDLEGVRQAIANLVNNAIKYNRRGGEVSVRLERSDDGARITVSDTGIGIPSEHQSRIFERFYRVDRGRSRELGGTGLGLAIVKHVAETHGGEVSVESEAGHGSTFTLTLRSDARAGTAGGSAASA